jgi:hypothetical protein
LTPNNATNREGDIKSLSIGTISLLLAAVPILAKHTIASNIVISSHPNDRTIWRRTKHRRQTLTAEIARKMDVTVEIALPWLSSMVT